MEEKDREVDPDLGIKRLTTDNWLAPDPTSALFVRLSVIGAIPITPAEWAEHFLCVTLADRVPRDVRQLFAVARAVMLYGAFFYPLYGLGQERLFEVADAAVLHRYRLAGGARQTNGRWPRYLDRLRWLAACHVLDEETLAQWQAFRELRNAAAHPEQQTIVPPGPALQMLTVVAREIDSLFTDPRGRGVVA
jgi:hypothetical protein